MAGRKRGSGNEARTPWLITFSDLMTLLLTFFVLLFSMSSMDSTIIARISAKDSSLSPMDVSGPGQIPRRIEEVVQMLLKDPENLHLKQKRLKDLLFPNEVLPPEVTRGDLDKNLSILQHAEGIVIVLTDSLLFGHGSEELRPAGRKLLDELTPVMWKLNVDVNISGYSSANEKGPAAYELSFRRAARALEHFLHSKLPADRFSLSGYGPDRPLDDQDMAKNRRVEILLKTTPRLAGYV